MHRTAPTERDEQATAWLIQSDEPGIALQAQGDLSAKPTRLDPDEVLRGRAARTLLDGQQPDGGFGGHPYDKWTGAHWRLLTLVDLGLSGPDEHATAAVEPVLSWLLGERHLTGIKTISGRTRRCATQEGNTLAICTRLGMAGEAKVKQLAASLVEWQWPLGGWNCDREPLVTHPSVHESLPPMWGLGEYASATGDADARAAAERAAEFFLEHRVYKSHRTGDVGNHRWLRLHYPTYWHYDALLGLHALGQIGRLPDRRADDAVALLRAKQLPNGRWRPEG